MSRSKNTNADRSAKGTAVPYTDHLKKVVDFANSERSVRSGGVTETLSNIDIMIRKQFEAGLSGKTLALVFNVRALDPDQSGASKDH
jgi:hypothetical protein